MPFTVRKCLFLSLMFLVFLGAATCLRAQSTGSITGTVSDPTGASIPGATVTVASPATGLSRVAETNASGNFVFPDLPIGAYTLQITKAGFETQKRSATELLTGQTIGLDIKLVVGAATQSVDVGADTQQIQTTTPEIASSVDQQQMQDLPLNQRNPLHPARPDRPLRQWHAPHREQFPDGWRHLREPVPG
jgi:hypothetical protein